jgi:2,4-diaminopentanoate dehydrogenase
MAIRVLHWGTGPTGCAALRGILGRPDLELVGLYVARPERAGRDAGDFVDLPDTGVVATNGIDAFRAIHADVLSYFGPMVASVDDVIPFLRDGLDVVTTAYASLVLPAYAPREIIDPVQAACREGNSSLFATGVEPGMFSDLIPTTLLTAVDELHSIRVTEIGNYGGYPVEMVMRLWGFGAQPDEHLGLYDLALGLWTPVVRNLADELAVELDDITLRTDSAITAVDVPTACYTVPAGTIGAVRAEVIGMKDGHEFIVVEHINYVSPDACRHWPLALGGEDTVYRIEITGRPQLRCEIDLDVVPEIGMDSGLVATAMRAINAIPWIVDARPGVLGPMDVPVRPSRNPRPGGQPLAT